MGVSSNVLRVVVAWIVDESRWFAKLAQRGGALLPLYTES